MRKELEIHFQLLMPNILGKKKMLVEKKLLTTRRILSLQTT